MGQRLNATKVILTFTYKIEVLSKYMRHNVIRFCGLEVCCTIVVVLFTKIKIGLQQKQIFPVFLGLCCIKVINI